LARVGVGEGAGGVEAIADGEESSYRGLNEPLHWLAQCIDVQDGTQQFRHWIRRTGARPVRVVRPAAGYVAVLEFLGRARRFARVAVVYIRRPPIRRGTDRTSLDHEENWSYSYDDHRHDRW